MAPPVLLGVFALFGVFHLASADSTLSNLHQKLVENVSQYLLISNITHEPTYFNLA